MDAARGPVLPPTDAQLAAYELRQRGLSVRETAAALGISESAVKGRTLEVRRKLNISKKRPAEPLMAASLRENFLAVSAAYQAASVLDRDDMPIGDLYQIVANDLIGECA